MSSFSSNQATKNLIVTTGDISDVDGFFALAEYASTGADVVFVMNYPAYLNDNLKIEKNAHPIGEIQNGLGFDYDQMEYLKYFTDPDSGFLTSYTDLAKTKDTYLSF